MEGERLTTSQRLAAFAALAGGRYAWAKLSRAASVGRWADEPTHTARHRAWRLIQVAELAHGARASRTLSRVSARREVPLAVGARGARAPGVRRARRRARRLLRVPQPTARVAGALRAGALRAAHRVRARAPVARRARRKTRERRRRRRGGAPVAARADAGRFRRQRRVTRFTGSAVRGVRAVARDAPVRAGAVRPRGLLLLRGGARGEGAERRRAVPVRGCGAGARDAARQARGARLTRRVE